MSKAVMIDLQLVHRQTSSLVSGLFTSVKGLMNRRISSLSFISSVGKAFKGSTGDLTCMLF